MLQFRVTAKAQKELGIKPGDLAEPKKSDTILGNWYINKFTIDRRKTFIFVNETTLLSFVIFGVKKTNVTKTPEIFLRGLDQLLTFEKFNIRQVNKLFVGYDSYEFTKTTSRKVLGNINDLVSLYQHYILYDGGLKYCDLTEIIMKINRTPQRNLEWHNSIKSVRKLLENAKST